VKTVIFELSMSSNNSWNRRWSVEDKKHTVSRKLPPDKEKEIVGRSFSYAFGDGWTACVSVRYPNPREKATNSFQGYNWMINSIINTGKIKKEQPPNDHQ
jgi:hypothetical protein